MTARALALVLAGLAASTLAPSDAFAAGGRDRKPESWDIDITPPGEPGQRLVLTGHVYSREHHKPLTGITVFVYHADSLGMYTRKGDERGEPRLCGILITNKNGEYRVRTTMPGGYESSTPHVHFEVWGPGVPKQMMFVNLNRRFVVGQMDTTSVSEMREAWARGSLRAIPDDPSAINRKVTVGRDGALQCTRDLVVDTK